LPTSGSSARAVDYFPAGTDFAMLESEMWSRRDCSLIELLLVIISQQNHPSWLLKQQRVFHFVSLKNLIIQIFTVEANSRSGIRNLPRFNSWLRRLRDRPDDKKNFKKTVLTKDRSGHYIPPLLVD
jgi:hypothetical protein